MLAAAALAACSTSTDATGESFVEEAEERGYNCVESVPSRESVVLLRTCTGPEGEALTFRVLDSQETARRMQLDTPGGGFGRGEGNWVVVGDDQAVVESVAEALGA